MRRRRSARLRCSLDGSTSAFRADGRLSVADGAVPWLAHRHCSSPNDNRSRRRDSCPGQPVRVHVHLGRNVDSLVSTTLTDDWWAMTLPEDPHTANMSGPANTYVAALNLSDVDELRSTLKVKDWFDPNRGPIKGVEKHHFFPEDYLKGTMGPRSTRQISHVANQALVELSDTIDLPNEARSPSTYWPAQLADKAIQGERLAKQIWCHALPGGWTDMTYPDFLTHRRKLIAKLTREGFRRVCCTSR